MANLWAKEVLPNGATWWVADVLPSLAGDGRFNAGDMILVVGATNPGWYRVTTGGTGATMVTAGPL